MGKINQIMSPRGLRNTPPLISATAPTPSKVKSMAQTRHLKPSLQCLTAIVPPLLHLQKLEKLQNSIFIENH